jgi:diguanylate cyclase (GGDEF)-like protein/PAS domain S-box-containing protein
MDIALLSVLTAMLTSALIVLVYLYLYFHEKEPCIAIWTLAFAMYLPRHVCQYLLLVTYPGSVILLLLEHFFMTASTMLLLLGTLAYLKKPLRYMQRTVLITALLAILCVVLLMQNHTILKQFAYFILTAVAVYNGVLFTRVEYIDRMTRVFALGTFVLYGCYRIVFAFLFENAGFYKYSFNLSIIFKMLLAVSILFSFMLKRKHDYSGSEDKFRLLTVNGQDIIYRYRTLPTPCYEYVSPSAIEMTGYTAEEFYRNPYLYLVITYKDDRNKLVQFLESLQDIPKSAEVRLVRKDGQLLWIEFRGVRIYDAKGEAVAVEGVIRNIDDRKTAELALIHSEQRYRTLAENTLDTIVEMDMLGTMLYVSPNSISFGYEAKELIGRNAFEFIHSDDHENILRKHKMAAADKGSFQVDYRFPAKDGTWCWLESVAKVFETSTGELRIVLVNRDVTKRKEAEMQLNVQKAYFQQLFESSPEAIVMLHNDDRIIKANRGFENLFQYKHDEITGEYINSLIVPQGMYEEATDISNTVINGQNVHGEAVRQRKDGSLVDVEILGYPILVDGNQVGIFGIYSDITVRKKVEEQLLYLSWHDALTGLYNRTYFEREMNRLNETILPVALLICDVDGLKLINDTMGHDAGDAMLIEAAKIIRNCFRDSGIFARIGGDEFSILLPGVEAYMAESMCSKLRESVDEYNVNNSQLPLSISIGLATRHNAGIFMTDVFKEADNNMYREKLHRSQSAKSAIVQTLMKALEARDFITEGHGERLQDLVALTALSIGMSEQAVSDLRLLAQFHDIGKVGISDNILFKAGPLTPEEKEEMKRHSEIGYRIARSSPDLVPIADWILKHHEWWNGKGYPFGLKGTDIPLEARILGIVDAYDAMTSDRPYRKALSHGEAIAELLRYSAIQFDPELVVQFTLVIEPHVLARHG